MPVPRLRFTVQNTDLSGRQVEITAAEAVYIGRTSDNMVVLDHKSVSRRHARIESNGDSFVLIDLESHNGTRVGGKLVEGKQAIQPGDVLRFGEVDVQFAAVTEGQEPAATPPTVGIPADAAAEAAESTAGAPANVPAVIGEQMLPTAPGERPLSFDDVFGQAAAAEEEEAPEAARRGVSPLLYGLTLLVIIVLGALAIWRVGYEPPGPPIIGIKVRAGEVIPVNLAHHLSRINEVGEPTTERVAYAKKTKFPFIITIHGRSGGSADIPLYGPPKGKVILRVIVAGVKPPPEHERWKDMPPSWRKAKAAALLRRAGLTEPPAGAVNENTTRAMRDYEIAHKLLANIPGQERRAAEAAKKARDLGQAREKRYDDLARSIESERRRADWNACDRLIQKLLRIYNDPDSVERLVIQYMYDVLVQEQARSARASREER